MKSYTGQDPQDPNHRSFCPRRAEGCLPASMWMHSSTQKLPTICHSAFFSWSFHNTVIIAYQLNPQAPSSPWRLGVRLKGLSFSLTLGFLGPSPLLQLFRDLPRVALLEQLEVLMPGTWTNTKIMFHIIQHKTISFFPGLIGRGIESLINSHFPPSTCSVETASILQIKLRQLSFFSFIEMKIKSPMRYHLLKWLLSQRQEKTSVGEHVEERKALCTSGGNVNWYS